MSVKCIRVTLLEILMPSVLHKGYLVTYQETKNMTLILQHFSFLQAKIFAAHLFLLVRPVPIAASIKAIFFHLEFLQSNFAKMSMPHPAG